jgi:exonuclease III
VGKLKLEIMGIYEPADHTFSREFLTEITNKINSLNEPLIMGGDFNLIRSQEDKNNDSINWARLNMFNDAISDWEVREIPPTGARFTWTNKQLNPVRSVVDRVFISPLLEPRFPLCSVAAETSLGSNHTPLILDTRDDSPIRSNRFFFETGWFE